MPLPLSSLMLLMLLALPGMAWAQPAANLEAPAEVEQGAAFLVRLTTEAALSQAQADFLGRSFRAWPEQEGVYAALVGVGAEERPGAYHLIFTGVDEAGGRLAVSRQVSVRPADFGTQRLKLPPKMVSPDAATLAAIAAQKARLEELLANATPERLWEGGLVRPVPGKTLSSFGLLRVLNGEPRSRHAGIDLRAAHGEPVRAAAAGRVVVAEPFYYEGNLIVLDHGLGLATIYCHLSEFAVKAGDMVARGQVIGKAGASGRATGPHLHFGARLGDVRIDPLSLFKLLGETP